MSGGLFIVGQDSLDIFSLGIFEIWFITRDFIDCGKIRDGKGRLLIVVWLFLNDKKKFEFFITDWSDYKFSFWQERRNEGVKACTSKKCWKMLKMSRIIMKILNHDCHWQFLFSIFSIYLCLDKKINNGPSSGGGVCQKN